MNPKNTWMLVVLAAGLFAFIYFFERHIQPPVPVVAKVLPGLKADDVSSIDVQPRGQFGIRVERVNGTWQMTKPIVYPVRAAAVEALLKALTELSPQRRISAEELQNNRQISQSFGFDTPRATILLQQGDDQRRLALGNSTAPGDGVYAQVVGTEGVDIINAAFTNLVPTGASQWRDRAFVSLQGLPIDELDVTTAGNSPLKFQRDDPGKPWRMLQPVTARANNELINHLLDQLQILNISQFVTDDTNADLESYGLQAPQLALTFKDKSTNQLLSIQFGKSPANDTNSVYAHTNSSSTIVLVPREDLKPWTAETWRFRDPYLFSLGISNQPASIECNGPNGRTNFVIREINDNLVVSDGQGLTYRADPGAVVSFLKNLAEMQVVQWSKDRFADDAVSEPELPAMGLAPDPLRRYVLHGASTGGAAPVIAQVDFGLPDTNQPGAICARRSDLPAEQTVFAVNSADVDRLPTSAVQLRLRTIWTFDATNVSHLVMRANGQTKEWDHRKRYVWQPVPNGFTDETKGMYMENLVDILGSLEAAAWIGPGEPTAEYGFNANSVQFSVTLTNVSPPTLTVTFGGRVPNAGEARYACTALENGQNWLFIYSAKDVNYLAKYMPTD